VLLIGVPVKVSVEQWKY